MASLRATLAAFVTGIATALVVVAIAILAFLNPVWVGFEQGRAQAAAWTGFSQGDLSTVTSSILGDLVIGPPGFAVALDGTPVLNEREREHMRNVRSVFAGFFIVALIGAGVLAAAFAYSMGSRGRDRLWRRLARTGRVIAVVTIAGGALGMVFFDAAFEVFHRLLFPVGTYLFDPRTDRLVQLFPEQFWVDTTIAVGILVIVLGLVLARVADRRAARLER